MRQFSKSVSLIALATALTLSPAFIADVTHAEVDMAYAKNGNGNGNGNRGNGNAGKDERSSSRGPDSRGERGPRRWQEDEDGQASASLHPSEKGRWNASKANQNALDAHIRNQNFNGTIGILSQYQLAAKAANGEPLNSAERAALDNFVDTSPEEVSDSDIARFLNQGSERNGFTFASTDGTITCVGGCDDLSVIELAALEARAQNAADGFVTDKRQTALQDSLDDFLHRSERRIEEDSNKRLTSERNQDLLDDIASDLAVVRRDVSDDFRDAGREIRNDLQQAGGDIRRAINGLFNN